MKKTPILVLGLCAAFVLTSCKSQESAYKKAYEKAQAEAAAEVEPGKTVVAVDESADEVAVTPVQPAAPAEEENVATRTIPGGVQVVSGNELKAYSVVVGSFTVQANAEGLKGKLQQAGYDARVIKTEETINGHTGWYRVIASSYDTKSSAVQSRKELAGQYKDAWILSK